MTDARWLDDTQQQAWQALLVFVNRGLPELERTFKAHDLLAVHYAILVALSSSPDGTLRLSELADSANLSQSRLTHRLRALIDRGDVTVASAADDGRGKNAILTKKGRQLLERVAPIHVEDVQRIVFDQLTPTETKHVANALSKVAAALCDRDAFLPSRP